MRLTIYRRQTHAFYASFDAVNFSPPVAAVGDDEEPVPLARLAGPADPRLLAFAADERAIKRFLCSKSALGEPKAVTKSPSLNSVSAVATNILPPRCT